VINNTGKEISLDFTESTALGVSGDDTRGLNLAHVSTTGAVDVAQERQWNRNLQESLLALGYYGERAAIDGIKGPNTVAAVKRFQREEGLAIDGIIGELTGHRLDAVLRRSSELREAERLNPGLGVFRLEQVTSGPNRAVYRLFDADRAVYGGNDIRELLASLQSRAREKGVVDVYVQLGEGWRGKGRQLMASAEWNADVRLVDEAESKNVSNFFTSGVRVSDIRDIKIVQDLDGVRAQLGVTVRGESFAGRFWARTKELLEAFVATFTGLFSGANKPRNIAEAVRSTKKTLAARYGITLKELEQQLRVEFNGMQITQPAPLH
jgi:peptidoglycan hydrolase-like protein with peptidoglycan-binding domain